MAAKEENAAVGVPYGNQGLRWGQGSMYHALPTSEGHAGTGEGEVAKFHVGFNPYQAGMIPPNAIFDDPKGIPIHQTIFRDTPAPFNCVFCGNSGLTTIRSKPSLAAAVACMSTMAIGFCFLLPSMDYLWDKYHYCPHCGEKVGEFEKSDPFIVADLPNWVKPSYALPA